MYFELTALCVTVVALMTVDWVNSVDLYHYTTCTNYARIMSSGVIQQSQDRKYYPAGTYLTGLSLNMFTKEEITKRIWGKASNKRLGEGSMNCHVHVRIPTNDPNLVAVQDFWRYEGDIKLSDYQYSIKTFSEECLIDKAAFVALVVVVIIVWAWEEQPTSTESTPAGDAENVEEARSVRKREVKRKIRQVQAYSQGESEVHVCQNCGINLNISLKARRYDVHGMYCS